MTERLYLKDSYLVNFTSRVVKNVPLQQGYGLILEKTAFYPTSGGQLHDQGTIEGLPVTDVREENDDIIHVLSQEIKTDQIRGQIDWPRRFDFMQQHTGFHILAQSFLRVLNAETLSSHLGEESSTIDVSLSSITHDEIEQVELLANQVVFENREVKAYFVDKEKLDVSLLRKAPTKAGTIRLIDIADFDLDPCGGTHVRWTGEVGIVKIKGWEKIRGILRFEFYAGRRALVDYQSKTKTCRQLSNLLSMPEAEFVPAIEKLRSDLKAEVKKTKSLSERLIEYEAKEMISDATSQGQSRLMKIFDDRDLSQVRYLANKIIKTSSLMLLFGIRGERANIILARPEGEGPDLREVMQQVSHLIEGRGGGRPNFVEAGGPNVSGLEVALKSAEEILKHKSSDAT